jgi:hypothetical protein
MARFNPQAFIAGMQSLLTPQQQAQQQVQQMRMQQMNQARENEALINARQLQGEQLGIQRKEAERAGVRFDLEKEANERAKAAEERAKRIQDLQLSGAKTDAAKGFLDPVAKAKSAYTAAQTAYNTAKSRPAAYSRADYLKITNDLTKAQTEYEQELAKQKTLLKYVDPSYGFDETIFGAPIEFTAPLSQADAIKALKDAQAGSKGTKPAPPPPPPGEEPTKVGMQAGPVAPATQVAAAEPAGIDPLRLLAPASLGVGVTASAGIGAVKPPSRNPNDYPLSQTIRVDKNGKVMLGKDGKPLPPPYKPPVLPPRGVRQRVYPESPDMFLTADEQEAAGKMLTAYEDYVTRTFNVDPLDANFNEKYYRYISDPNVFKRFTDRYARQLAISSPESAASILASTESMLLGSIGDKADVPTALRTALMDAETKKAALVEAKEEAAYKKTYRPLTISELKAKIAYYQSGGSRGNKTVDPFKGIGGRVSAVTQFGRGELIELDKLIQENETALRKTKKDYPVKWKEWAGNSATETYKQQQIVDEARQIRAKILSQQSSLRKLVPDPGKFYSAFISFDPVSSVRNPIIAMRLRANVGPQAGDFIPYNNESPEASPTPGIDDPPSGF